VHLHLPQIHAVLVLIWGSPMCLQEENEKLTAELGEIKAKGSGDAEALSRAKQHAAELSEDLEAANRELEVLHLQQIAFFSFL
jgi:hypothetical protein